MRGLRIISLLMVLSVLCCGPVIDRSSARGEEGSVVKGIVTDVEGRPVEGAIIYAYVSPEVRKPADFMSGRTGGDGLFRMVLPPGKYWLVARVKKTDAYGPLMPGDRHSGEAVEIELAQGGMVERDFVVADLKEAKEALKGKAKAREGAFRISGRILDEQGSPLKTAYAFANRQERVSGIPDFLSAWVDSEGRFTLYVPRGRYYVGAAITFPPGENYFMSGEMTLDGDKSGVDIVIKTNSGK